MPKLSTLNLNTKLHIRAKSRLAKHSALAHSPEFGYIALTVIGLVIPLLFLLSITAVEIVGYFRAKQELHSALERELELLSRNLSSKVYAENILLERIAAQMSLMGISLSSSSIRWQTIIPPRATLELKGNYRPYFSSFPLITGIIGDSEIPINANATVQLAAMNTAVIVDVGSNKAPDITQTDSNYEWVEDGIVTGASWFNSAPSLYFNDTPVAPLKLSLRCFNSRLSPIKRASITLIDILQYFGGKKCLLGFLSDSWLDQTNIATSADSSVTTASQSAPPDNRLSVISKLGDYPYSTFTPYTSFSGRDSWCAAAAESEQLNPYLFSTPPLPTLSLEWGATVKRSPNIFESLTPPIFSSQYLDQAPLREQIWFRAASEVENTAAWTVLHLAAGKLIDDPNPTSLSSSAPKEDADLATSIARNVIFLITDTLPYRQSTLADEYRTTITLINQKAILLGERLTISLILVAPNDVVLGQIEDFAVKTKQLMTPGNLQLEITLLERSPQEQEERLIQLLARSRRIVRYQEW